MSRLGLRLAFAFAALVAALIGLLSWRTIEIIAEAQENSLRAESAANLAAILRVLDEESNSISERLRPLARVRELRFRAQPVAAAPLPAATADTNRAADTSSRGTDSPAGEGAPETAAATIAGDLIPAALPGAPLDPVGLQRFVEEILPVTGLDALEVTTLAGEVLARGQYPESFGELRDDTATIALLAGPNIGIRDEPFREGKQAALYAAVPIQAESESAVAALLSGGIRLDRLVERLARLTGTTVEIRAEGRTIRSVPNSPAGVGLIRSGGDYFWAQENAWSVRGVERARIRILLPATEGVRARTQLVTETTAFAAAALVAAALAGIGLALGPTRRLAHLTRSAIRIGEGDLETPVNVSGSDEIGILGLTLANTASALKAERERLAHAERVAAWRDAARRIAHELKNAITPIGLAVRTVQRAAEKGPDAPPDAVKVAAEALHAISEELGALRSLVDQFSQFARLPAPRLAAYDVVHALKSAATVYGADQVEIRFRTPDQLLPIRADEELMSRVWSNLIANAVHAAGREGAVEIEVIPPTRGSVVVTISDSGPGLSRERLEGRAGEGASTKAGGWGLGLALAERIVTEHGGSIALENVPESGARVRVTLPTGEEEAS
jgi:signal transduction histidine kinase